MTDDLQQLFDGIYGDAGRDDGAVPWQHAASRDAVARWMADFVPADHHQRGLVVAAGLGDDAAALARLGLEVVAFDRSPAAVEWAQERHADVGVTWTVTDLFDTPRDWSRAFDLVVEVFTIQSIPPDDQLRAATRIADFVAPGGLLLIVAAVGAPGVTPAGPPWPLDPTTLDALEGDAGGRPPLERVSGDAGPLRPEAMLVVRELRRPRARSSAPSTD